MPLLPLAPLLLLLLSDLFLYAYHHGVGDKCNFQPTLPLIAHLVNIFSICSVIVFGAKWLSTPEILLHQSKHL